MKNVFYFCFLLLLIVSCKKYKEKDIVVTDSNGNIISSNESNDWQNQNFYSDALYNYIRTQLCIQVTNGLFNDSIPPDLLNTENCSEYVECENNNNEINFLFYPNPAPKGGESTLRINSTKKILAVAYGNRNTKSDNISTTYFQVPNITSDSNLIYIPIRDEDFPYRGKQDFELYITVMTNDTCYYFTKGKIKWN